MSGDRIGQMEATPTTQWGYPDTQMEDKMTTTTPGSYGAAADRTDDRRRIWTFTETKLGYKTSEFLMMLIFVAGVIIAAYASSSDALSREDGWRFASFVAAAYIVSRGLAKLGSREPYEREL
jgi:hypothetical protein